MAKINEALAKAEAEGKFPVWLEEAQALADSLKIE